MNTFKAGYVSESIVDFNVFSEMASKRLIDTELSLFKVSRCLRLTFRSKHACISFESHYLFQMPRDPPPLPLHVTRKCDDRAHISRARNQFVSRSRSIRIYSFVTKLFRSANYPDVLSRITAAFLSPNVLGIRVSRGQ